jgi:hypothetical protein
MPFSKDSTVHLSWRAMSADMRGVMSRTLQTNCVNTRYADVQDKYQALERFSEMLNHDLTGSTGDFRRRTQGWQLSEV